MNAEKDLQARIARARNAISYVDAREKEVRSMRLLPAAMREQILKDCAETRDLARQVLRELLNEQEGKKC